MIFLNIRNVSFIHFFKIVLNIFLNLFLIFIYLFIIIINIIIIITIIFFWYCSHNLRRAPFDRSQWLIKQPCLAKEQPECMRSSFFYHVQCANF